MAFANIENLAAPSTSTKAMGKRKKHPFKLKSRQRFDPPLFIPKSQLPKKRRSSAYGDVLNPYRKMALDDNPVMKATTARNNDGMSFVW